MKVVLVMICAVRRMRIVFVKSRASLIMKQENLRKKCSVAFFPHLWQKEKVPFEEPLRRGLIQAIQRGKLAPYQKQLKPTEYIMSVNQGGFIYHNDPVSIVIRYHSKRRAKTS